MLLIMVEAAKDYISQSVTNGLGFEPIRVPRKTFLQPKSRGKIYDRKIDLYLHLAEMNAMVTDDPEEKKDIGEFIKYAEEWRNTGLPRLGLNDFDVKRPEELVTRVSEFVRRGPLIRTRVSYINTPVTNPESFHIRKDLALLGAGILIFLLPATHTDAFAQSEGRSMRNLQDGCTTIQAMIQSDPVNLEVWRKYSEAYRVNLPSPDDTNFIEKCTDLAWRHYMGEEDLGKIATDGERMFRYGFGLTFLAGFVTALAGTHLLITKGISRLTSRGKKTLSS